MTRNTSILALAGGGLLLAACAGDPSVNREAAVELEPMAKPASLPTNVKAIHNGEPYVSKVISMEGDQITRMVVGGSDDGCTYTNDGWFAPSAEFKDCEGNTGTQDITKTGEIWPLTIGSTENYSVSGTSGSNTWQTKRRCEVKDAVMVTLQEKKQLATYEVVCTDKWNTRTWYVSPELGQTVKFKRYNNSRGLVSDSEMLVE